MIFGKISDMPQFYAVCPQLEPIYVFLTKQPLKEIATGDYVLVPDSVKGGVSSYETKEREGRHLEAHRKYADVQVMFQGCEIIEWAHMSDCNKVVSEEFSKGGDIGFYEDPARLTSLMLDEGFFVLLNPEDAHKPCLKADEKPMQVTKAVFKIKL